MLGADPTLGQVASLRRLHFEFTTLIVATSIEQVKSDSAEPGSLVKKLPGAENQARLERQQERHAGTKMVGEMAPSHQIDRLGEFRSGNGCNCLGGTFSLLKGDDEIHANIKPPTATA